MAKIPFKYSTYNHLRHLPEVVPGDAATYSNVDHWLWNRYRARVITEWQIVDPESGAGRFQDFLEFVDSESAVEFVLKYG